MKTRGHGKQLFPYPLDALHVFGKLFSSYFFLQSNSKVPVRTVVVDGVDAILDVIAQVVVFGQQSAVLPSGSWYSAEPLGV
jgi:hypothetical protein